ncbi:platelet binding protein GspB isoform X3 [Drosophila albomicans]|uniref:Platelet binding protein GspB isoform X3 n=1 Tax=Drosophila albomicans TaxID=7291 RepID=A0A9C6T293_DROAB|nr:platelet binding protein GspB isoform X3 [Drosophila albomicans]
MEHLDLAGYLNTPVNWNLGAFEHQDVMDLSSSRQMLEPIMEETSEDEEHAQNSWNGYEHRGSCGGFWSSAESETGSVIRVEINKDIDAMSERDFACPPKRARRSQDEQMMQLQQLQQSQLQQQQPHSLEDVVQLRRPPPPRYDADSHNSLERFLALEACARDSYGSQGQRNSTGSRRGGCSFDDFYSDNDSYHSLSRSSSLVQFESLERQMTLQEQHQSMSSLGNSSPSLLSCETMASSSGNSGSGSVAGSVGGSHSNPDSRRGSATSLLKRYESSDGRLHQTYYELHKLDFEEQQRELFGACKSLHHQAELKSDSESSSTSSSDSSGHSMLSACPGKQDAGGARRLPLNSAENLSEDSGYGEPGSTLRRAKSKSIPKNFDKLCEEEEMEELLLLEHEVEVETAKAKAAATALALATHSKNSNDLCQTKIEQTNETTTTPRSSSSSSSTSSSLCSPTSSINSGERGARSPSPSPSASPSRSPSLSPTPSGSSTTASSMPSTSLASPASSSSSSSPSSSSSAASFTWLRNSLPDIREPRGSSPKSIADNNSYVLANNSNNNNSRSSSSRSSSSAECSPVLATRASTTSSVPNELQQLGRRRRANRPRANRPSSSDGHSSSEDLDQFDCHSLPRIRRSCSWNDRGGGASAGAGYLNASYQNLTLLDYTDQRENCKRSSFTDMDKRGGKDYEHLICKGNFLLDELSQIYDKNVSILNDKAVDVEEKQPVPHKSVQDLVDEAPPQVQHVQLTIRKPPARQRRIGQADKEPVVLSQEVTPVLSFSSFGKTFDQDPTNLRTSYAQSLEQCNIDVPPTQPSSNSCHNKAAQPVRMLPKRRFQSTTAKQRSLVSSTPNLSAFDGGGQETEDDIYVSSAHNSMHQLPQTAAQPKPLGILLPAGSRNSFSKEVSFCPVVSKYSWQEQSSEEPPEEQSSDQEEEDDDGQEEEEDNDATVIYNTKENENVAARYNAEQQQQQLRALQQQQLQLTATQHQQQLTAAQQQLRETQQREQREQRAPERECAIDEKSAESDDNNENIASADTNQQQTTQQQQQQPQTKTSQTSQPATTTAVSVPSVTAAVSLETRVVASSSSALVAPVPATVPHPVTAQVPVANNLPTRPLSLHLPILSEPPTNRAHHILYASQQLLQRYDNDIDIDDVDHHRHFDRSNMSKSSQSVSLTPSGNNNESPLKQRANKTDEKHPSSKSFLSRFAHGLRFSLRRKKKQQQQQQQQQQQPATTTKAAKQSAKQSQQSNGKSQDIVHIPLKPPRSNSGALDDSNISEASTASMHSRQTTTTAELEQLPKTSTLQKLVTGKPPLPKQPPRLTHAPTSAAHQQQPAAVAISSAAHASNALLDAEREQYAAFAKQLTSGHQQTNTTAMRETETVAGVTGTESPSRASVAQKTQMFNQLGAGASSRPLTMVTAVPVAVSPMLDNKMGLIETNLDTHETVISGKTRSLMDITCNPVHQQHKRYLVKRLNVTSAAYDVEHEDDDDDDDVDGQGGQHIKTSNQASGVQIASVRRPHKSMEFLLDKENQKNVLPPENELQKSHDHNPAALSEHQLRVQASLQRLNIPDWFRQYNQNAARSPDGACAAAGGTSATSGGYKPGNFTRKRTQDSGRWQGLNSKTTSLSSLGSQRSDRSPLLLSPSAHSHHGGQSSSVVGSAVGGHHHHGHHAQGVGATRWSTSHLNSTQTSPSVSQRGSFARGAPINSSFMSVASGSSAGAGSVLRNSYRQPYLGWRSTEKLSQRTPHERLANSLLAQRTSPTSATAATTANGVRSLQPVTPEIQSSIKEVTSAIVHYVNDQTLLQQQQQRSRSASPNSRKCWLESSFVGTRPLDSPQTPVIDSSSSPPTSQHQLHQQQFHLDASTVVATGQPPLRMNGLSRVGGGGADSTASRQQLEVEQQLLRRRSEGDAPSQQQQKQKQQNSQQNQTQSQSQSHNQSQSQTQVSTQPQANASNRRVSLGDSNAHADKSLNNGSVCNANANANEQQLQIRCRNTKCEQSATPADAKKLYKSCHNCTHLYCSRECRRAHWEKHRKACLHSRASNLCRQVLATCKDDVDSQRHLSLLARKGSLSQGRGVVRVLFRSAEAAEGFIKHGFQCMGEASYVRWPDLMPAEMGLELYSELLKLSTEYKPESKMLIYVAICVVSEAPGMGQAPVRWERQLVSRCAKLKLCKSVLAELELQQQALQQPLAVMAVPERTEILILTFNPGLRTVPGNRELILSNILDILSRRGVLLRKHYPEIFQRLQTYTEGQTDKFNPVTLHPRDSQTGQSFVCIIMPVHTDSEFIKLPSAADGGGNRVTTIDVGSPAALAQLDDDELLTRTTPAS